VEGTRESHDDALNQAEFVQWAQWGRCHPRISSKGPRMAKSVDDRGRGARLARRDEGDILAGM